MPGPYDSSRTPPPPGRTSFYEEYGVIRDVLQNHLTEVLTLVAMELPVNVSSPESVLQHKLQAFQALRSLQRHSAVLGQYQAYSGQVRRELQKPDSFHSLTPTFAGGPPGLGTGCWAAPPSPGGSSPPNTDPFRVGREGLEVGFYQSAWRRVRDAPASLAFCQPKAAGHLLAPSGQRDRHFSGDLCSVHGCFQGSPSWAQTWLCPGGAYPAPREAAGRGHTWLARSTPGRQVPTGALAQA